MPGDDAKSLAGANGFSGDRHPHQKRVGFRALVRGPALLLLDEPSLGLAPVIVKVIYQTIRRIRDLGMTILIAEQSAHVALKVANRALVLETGRLAFQGDANALALEAGIKDAYFGAAP
jgi:branched-chain amino acid transport system ATP-binding protein